MTDTYDAGYLPDDADCDQDSIRCELAYSHEFYSSIIQQNEERIAELEKDNDWLFNFALGYTNIEFINESLEALKEQDNG